MRHREKERYQREAERIGGGNPLFFLFFPNEK